MTNEADSVTDPPTVLPTAVSSANDDPVVLRGSGGTARVRPWPYEPAVAHLVIINQHQRVPSLADLARWAQQMHALGYTSVRTGALGTVAGSRVESAGYVAAQELTLLAHDNPGAGAAATQPSSPARTARLTVRLHQRASDIDRAAFAPGWQLDPGAIGEVCRATPRHRGRLVYATPDDLQPSGYAITGRDARQGFLQRLAVHPDAQGQGHGRALVHDCLTWLVRWRAQRVLVNTATDNVAALTLYERAGFHRLAERLRVYERTLA